jgi:hypothetical protein
MRHITKDVCALAGIKGDIFDFDVSDIGQITVGKVKVFAFCRSSTGYCPQYIEICELVDAELERVAVALQDEVREPVG